MRNREQVFVNSLQNYLKAFFTQKARENEIEDIVLWQDILEDAIRSDWTLGGTCLQVLDGAEIRPGCTNDVYTAGIRFRCEVDLGGYVYGNTEEDS